MRLFPDQVNLYKFTMKLKDLKKEKIEEKVNEYPMDHRLRGQPTEIDNHILLNQELDHEVDALLQVLRHNLRTIGTPLDGQAPGWSTSPYDNYAYLQENSIAYVDALGFSFLMPCLNQNPTQTEQVRNMHQHYTLDCPSESLAMSSRQDGKRHMIEIDSARTLKS